MKNLLRELSLTIILIVLHKVSGASVNQVQLSIKNKCPAPENIPKCTCALNPTGLSVTCKNFKDDTEFKAHLTALQGYYLEKLEISNYKASSIPEDLWKGLAIERLSLTGVDVNDASFRRGKRHFQGLEATLQRLEISNSFRDGSRPLLNLQLDHLENLRDAIFERNNIPEVGNDWFTSGPKSLKSLIFEGNNIEELGDRAFDSLSNLKLLAVAGNHLRTLSRTMLPRSASSLTTLDLAYNKIRTIPEDIFSGMPLLEDVNLEFNLLPSINQETWKPVSSQLKMISLKGNPLKCDDSMKWMCDTNLKEAEGMCSSPKKQPLQQFCTS